MTDERSSAEIEREIEAERGALAGTLRDIRESVSVEAAVQRIAESLRSNSGEIAGAVGRQVRANPLGVALTGIGLAWLMMGPHTPDAGRGMSASGRRFDDDDDDDWAVGRSDVADRGAYRPSPGLGFEDSMYAGEELGGMDAGARDGDEADQGNGSTGAGWTGSGAGSAARRLRSRSADLRSRMQHGLEDLSGAARERVLAARRAAVHARQRAESIARRGTRRAAGFYHEAPLVSGAVAMAVGAAVGALLPRTRTEDDLMGAESDRLMDEARRIYDEEKSRLADAGRAVVETGREAAGEIADAAGKALTSAGQRMDDREPGQTGSDDGTDGSGMDRPPPDEPDRDLPGTMPPMRGPSGRSIG